MNSSLLGGMVAGKKEQSRGATGFRRRVGQQGAVLAVVAFTLLLLLGFAAFAIDMAYLYVARNELQNAADSAALAGAGYLYPGPPAPNWDVAQSNATRAVSGNKVTNVTLTDGQVTYGYWDTTGAKGLQLLPMTPGPNDMPAVKVNILKAGGQNGGEVPLFFAKVFGISSTAVGASAVAVASSPSSIGPGGGFPLAIPECMFKKYWDTSTSPPSLTDGSTAFPIYSINYSKAPPCSQGQWTSYDLNTNNVPTIRNLIALGATLDSNSTWIDPGTKATLYDTVNACSAAGDKSCEYVTVPVVTDISTTASVPVTYFACLHILGAQKTGNDKNVSVQMSNKCKASNAGGNNPNPTGVYMPPRLAG